MNYRIIDMETERLLLRRWEDNDAIELKLNGHTDMTDRDDECELLKIIRISLSKAAIFLLTTRMILTKNISHT